MSFSQTPCRRFKNAVPFSSEIISSAFCDMMTRFIGVLARSLSDVFAYAFRDDETFLSLASTRGVPIGRIVE